MLESLLNTEQQLSLMQQLILYFVVAQIISWLLMRYLFNSNISAILAVIGPVFAGYMVYIALFLTKKAGLESADSKFEFQTLFYWLIGAAIYLFFLLFILGFEKNATESGYFGSSIFSIIISFIVIAAMLETNMLKIKFNDKEHTLEEIHMQAPTIGIPKLKKPKDEMDEPLSEDDIYVPRDQ